MAKIEIIKQKDRNFLWIDDELWMWDIQAEQEAQKILSDDAYGDVLVAGHGLGILHRFLAQNPQVSSITTVELLPELIEAVRDEYGEIFGKIIITDFFQYSSQKRYDCVIGDVWLDIAPPALALYNRFEAHAKTLVKPDGKILAWGQEFFHALNYVKNINR